MVETASGSARARSSRPPRARATRCRPTATGASRRRGRRARRAAPDTSTSRLSSPSTIRNPRWCVGVHRGAASQAPGVSHCSRAGLRAARLDVGRELLAEVGIGIDDAHRSRGPHRRSYPFRPTSAWGRPRRRRRIRRCRLARCLSLGVHGTATSSLPWTDSTLLEVPGVQLGGRDRRPQRAKKGGADPMRRSTHQRRGAFVVDLDRRRVRSTPPPSTHLLRARAQLWRARADARPRLPAGPPGGACSSWPGISDLFTMFPVSGRGRPTRLCPPD